MADMLQIQRPTYTRYETGEREPDFETVLKMSELLSVSTDFLLGKTDIPSSIDAQLSDTEFALYGEAKDLTDEEKQKVLDFIKFTKSQRQ